MPEIERGGNICRIHYTHPYDSPRVAGSTTCVGGRVGGGGGGGGGGIILPAANTNIDSPKVYFEMDTDQMQRKVQTVVQS